MQFPADEFPLLSALTVLAALDECALDFDLGSQQMLPLGPGAIPVGLKSDRIEPELKFAMRVAAQRAVVVEV